MATTTGFIMVLVICGISFFYACYFDILGWVFILLWLIEEVGIKPYIRLPLNLEKAY